jgi:hypothetical protein
MWTVVRSLGIANVLTKHPAIIVVNFPMAVSTTGAKQFDHPRRCLHSATSLHLNTTPKKLVSIVKAKNPHFTHLPITGKLAVEEFESRPKPKRPLVTVQSRKATPPYAKHRTLCWMVSLYNAAFPIRSFSMTPVPTL